MKWVALLFGLFVVALGSVGIAVPEVFVVAVGFFQAPPAIYLAAAVRVVVGIVLIRVAPASRAPRLLRVLGILIFIGGLVTPFIGVQLAQQIIEWWAAGGPALVRGYASVGLAVGLFIVYAVAPRRRNA